jgi:aspartyl protease family protein
MGTGTHAITFVIGSAFGAILLSEPSPPPPPAPRPAMVSDAVDTVVNRDQDGHFYVDAMVNGQLVHFMVDTGATNVALTEADARHIGLTTDPREYSVVGMGAGGPVRGTRVTLNSVAIGQKEAREIDGVVIQGSSISLLGQAFLSHIGSVRIVGDQMILR